MQPGLLNRKGPGGLNGLLFQPDPQLKLTEAQRSTSRQAVPSGSFGGEICFWKLPAEVYWKLYHGGTERIPRVMVGETLLREMLGDTSGHVSAVGRCFSMGWKQPGLRSQVQKKELGNFHPTVASSTCGDLGYRKHSCRSSAIFITVFEIWVVDDHQNGFWMVFKG